MARRVRDIDHWEFHAIRQELEALKRELREVEPEAQPQPTVLIHNEAERRAVGAYLLAQKRDERAGTKTHVEAFRRERQQHRLYRQVVARIPAPSE